MKAGEQYQLKGRRYQLLAFPPVGTTFLLNRGDVVSLKLSEPKPFWGKKGSEAGGSSNYYLVVVVRGEGQGQECLIHRRHFDSGALKIIESE